MYVEFCLDQYNEDPVNLLVVRLAEKNVNAGKEDPEDPGTDLYLVEHVIEARGSRHVKDAMTIGVPSEFKGD